jgi:hypothetical protein
MPLHSKRRFDASRRRRARLCAAALVLGLALPAGSARADEVDGLRAENAELRRELDRARDEIRELRRRLGEASTERGAATASAEAPSASAPEREPAAATTSRTETDLVPVRRVRVEVEGSPGVDPARLSSEWMPVRDGLRVLESIRLVLVRSDQGLTPRLALARSTPHGSLADVETATLVVDGETFSCPRVDFAEKRRQRRTPRGAALEREQIATYAIPAGELARISAARDASFTAGPTRFDLTDEHLAAAAALAARQERDGGAR